MSAAVRAHITERIAILEKRGDGGAELVALRKRLAKGTW